MGYKKTDVHDNKHNRFAKKVFEELNKHYKINLQPAATKGRYKIEGSVFGNNQMFSDDPGKRSWFKESMTIGENTVHLSSDWWPHNIPDAQPYARTIFDDLKTFVEVISDGEYIIKDEGTDNVHDYWLYKKTDDIMYGSNPNLKNAKQIPSDSDPEDIDGYPDNVNIADYPDKVIVDYTDPYQSFFWRGRIHLEIDIKARTLVSVGWVSWSSTTPLSASEIQKYIDFFCNVRNLLDFFNDRLAYDTPSIVMGSHYVSYQCRIQWGEKDKTIDVGEPIPYMLPF